MARLQTRRPLESWEAGVKQKMETPLKPIERSLFGVVFWFGVGCNPPTPPIPCQSLPFGSFEPWWSHDTWAGGPYDGCFMTIFEGYEIAFWVSLKNRRKQGTYVLYLLGQRLVAHWCFLLYQQPWGSVQSCCYIPHNFPSQKLVVFRYSLNPICSMWTSTFAERGVGPLAAWCFPDAESSTSCRSVAAESGGHSTTKSFDWQRTTSVKVFLYKKLQNRQRTGPGGCLTAEPFHHLNFPAWNVSLVFAITLGDVVLQYLDWIQIEDPSRAQVWPHSLDQHDQQALRKRQRGMRAVEERAAGICRAGWDKETFLHGDKCLKWFSMFNYVQLGCLLVW